MPEPKDIYISTTFSKDGSKVTDIIRICHDLGLDNLELGSNHCYEKDIKNNTIFNTGKYLVHNYFPPPEESFVLNIASFNEKIRKRSLEQAVSAMEFCSDIGANLYTFHPGFLSDPRGPSNKSNSYDFQWDDDLLELNSNREKQFDLMFLNNFLMKHLFYFYLVKNLISCQIKYQIIHSGP